MLRYLIEVVETLIPALIPLGALAGLTARRGSLSLARWSLYGRLLGVLIAVSMAAVRLATGRIVREFYDLAVLAAGIAAEFVLIALIAGRVDWRIPRRILAATLFLVSAAWLAFAVPDLVFFPFQFSVGRDTLVNEEVLSKGTGYLAGLILCLICHAAVKRIYAQLPAAPALAGFILSILFLFGSQSLTILRTLLGRNLVPRVRAVTRYVMYMSNHTDWFIFYLLGIAAAAAALLYFLNRGRRFPGDNPAQARKLVYAARVRRRWSAVLIAGAALSLATLTVGRDLDSRVVELSPPREAAARDGAISIPLDQVNDWRLHRFLHRTGERTEIRFIVIRKSDTAYGVGLDACDVCGPTGYYERGDQVICILCDVVMNKATIGFPGGCNPVPLAFSLASGTITIKTADLEKEKRRFE